MPEDQEPKPTSGVNRRNFIRTAAAGAAAVAIAPSVHASETSPETATAPSASAPFELEEATIADLRKGMESGRWSSKSLTAAYLRRIEQIDGKPGIDVPGSRRGRGRMLNSIIELNPDALAIAEERDRERKAGKIRGPLHGIPVVVKDNLDSAGPDAHHRGLARADGRSRRNRTRPWPPGSVRRARFCSEKRISRSGRTSARTARARAGAAVVARPATLTS